MENEIQPTVENEIQPARDLSRITRRIPPISDMAIFRQLPVWPRLSKAQAQAAGIQSIETKDRLLGEECGLLT